jgi:parallel beta-helix repeat protein
MGRSVGVWATALTGAFLLGGCGHEHGQSEKDKKAEAKKVVHAIAPGPDVQKKAQEVLIKVKPGEVVEFAEGRFEFKGDLSLAVDKVVVRGKGIDKTILSFKGQTAGSEGIKVKDADGIVFEDLSVEDAKGDAIKVEGAKGITFRRVKTAWTGGAKESNGAYGLYPVQCEDVLIEDCIAIAASDAGIYVGQSKNIIVRRSKAMENVAGIEIENSTNADVYECEATNNAGGLLVFDLPDLPVKRGQNVRLFKNKVYANNHANFAPKGNAVASVPPGTGIMVMATDQVEVFDNDVSDNQTCNLSLISYKTTERPIKDKDYDPYSESLYVHDNRFSGGGGNPSGTLGTALRLILKKTPFPDIIYDGIVNPKLGKDGELPSDLRPVIKNNGDADFVGLRISKVGDIKELIIGKAKPETDLKAYAGERAPLPPVKIAGVDG